MPVPKWKDDQTRNSLRDFNLFPLSFTKWRKISDGSGHLERDYIALVAFSYLLQQAKVTKPILLRWKIDIIIRISVRLVIMREINSQRQKRASYQSVSCLGCGRKIEGFGAVPSPTKARLERKSLILWEYQYLFELWGQTKCKFWATGSNRRSHMSAGLALPLVTGYAVMQCDLRLPSAECFLKLQLSHGFQGMMVLSFPHIFLWSK